MLVLDEQGKPIDNIPVILFQGSLHLNSPQPIKTHTNRDGLAYLNVAKSRSLGGTLVIGEASYDLMPNHTTDLITGGGEVPLWNRGGDNRLYKVVLWPGHHLKPETTSH